MINNLNLKLSFESCRYP